MLVIARLALCVPFLLAAGKSDGTCGSQCTDDSQCGGCGTLGKCSCPDGSDAKFPQISCTCVSAPANAPASPDAVSMDSAWPSQWTADVDAWCYADFTNKTAVANGKFYYDATLGKTRADWKPYINGKDATQVWITDAKSSHYYVKSGPVCIYFPISDPGQEGKPLVGIERPDWMQKCKDAGMAKYVGREQVNVEGEDVWVDHWSCHLDYEAAKQQITFQNWHSLGLGKTPKGLPVRVTGGNSAPNGQKGSPRLNSVWYKNFVTGSSATKPDDFKKPGWICIPVGAEAVKSFFGHHVRPDHTFSPAFHKRAHYFPHAKASAKDLMRARRPKPGMAFKGNTFATSMQKLNRVLLREKGLMTKKCDSFSVELLHEMQRELFNARTHELDAVYQGAGDTRRMAHTSMESLEAEQAKLKEARFLRLFNKMRDGVCHEMVMWYIHHLSEDARNEIKQRLVLPLLPEDHHEAPTAVASDNDGEVHQRYAQQASCAVCHVDIKAQDDTTVVV